jgi:hypothetical protein
LQKQEIALRHMLKDTNKQTLDTHHDKP